MISNLIHSELDKLMSYKDDNSVLAQNWHYQANKNNNKFADYIKTTAGIELNPQSILMCRVKRGFTNTNANR